MVFSQTRVFSIFFALIQSLFEMVQIYRFSGNFHVELITLGEKVYISLDIKPVVRQGHIRRINPQTLTFCIQIEGVYFNR